MWRRSLWWVFGVSLTILLVVVPLVVARLRTDSSGIPVSRGDLIPPADPKSPPVSLTIDAIGVDAAVVPTGVDSRNGQMAVPGNVRDVACDKFGPVPGEAGSAVLAAHVDLAGSGLGVFFRLRELEPGDLIEVGLEGGDSQRFRVQARTSYHKDELPLDLIFAGEGRPVLTLVTCGGGFNASQGRCDSNVVVFAVPATAPAVPPLQ